MDRRQYDAREDAVVEDVTAQTNAEPSWREVAGKQLVVLQQKIDANLSLFRAGCLLTMAGSMVAVVRFSGIFHRFNHVDEIPSWYFAQHKKLRVRIIRQCQDDPSVLYVYHTPFFRRLLLQDILPTAAQESTRLLAIRPFGIHVDETGEAWVWSNLVSSHRYVTLQLLHRMQPVSELDQSILTCAITLGQPPFRRDLAEELVSRGYGECIPESIDKYDNQKPRQLDTLYRRLTHLDQLQRNAQRMRYGIWAEWKEEKLSDRVVAASKRATVRGLQKLVVR